MKTYENSPVNEWNSTDDGSESATIWPWDLWVTKSPEVVDAGAAKGLDAKPAETVIAGVSAGPPGLASQPNQRASSRATR